MHGTRPESRLYVSAVGSLALDGLEAEIRHPGFMRRRHGGVVRRSVRLGREWPHADQQSQHGKKLGRDRHFKNFQR